MNRHLTHQFSRKMAVVLHRSPAVQELLRARLDMLGVKALGRQTALEPNDADADFLILDIDQAHDEQLPWQRGQAPLPIVALIGSESPGRLAWALDHQVDAFLPLTAINNIYSALVISRATFEQKLEQRRRDAETARRAGKRLDVIRAVLKIMDENDLDEATALKQLRAFSMVERLPLEDAAGLYLVENTARRKEGR